MKKPCNFPVWLFDRPAIQQNLERLGMTRFTLFNKLNLTPSQANCFFKTPPTIGLALMVADILGTDLRSLITRRENA